VTATGTGRLIDQGYRPYDGPRGGRAHAVRSVTRTTLWRALGIHRPARAKVFPVIAILLAYVPTAVYVGVAVIGNHLQRQGGPGRAFAGAFIPTYASNEVQVVLAVLVVACFVAPEVLCPDRRNGMLGLYLASPLDRFTYLWAKAQAILIVVAVVTIGPSLILLVGYTTQGYGPSDPAEWFATFGRIIAAGLVVSLLYTVISLAISSITSRKAVASAAFLAIVVGSSALATYLVQSGGQSPYLALANLASLPYEAVFRIFDEPSQLTGGFWQLTNTAIFVGYAAWLVGGLAVIVWRYRRIEVSR
jgi:ABC-2 type transport system permease protein